MIDFTKLLPSMKSGQELIAELSIIPKYDESICEQCQTVRLVALSDLYQLYIPSQMSLEIYSKLYLALLRSMQKKGTQMAIKQRYENYKAIQQQSYSGILGGSDSFTIIGTSGIGKSSAISRSISLITENRIIETDKPYTKIIPCLIVQCPFDSSVKGMLLEILRKVDEELGTDHYHHAITSRAATTDMLIGAVSAIALNHIGINNISDPQAKIAKYNEMVASLQSLQKQYQVTAKEQKNLNADMATLQGASNLTNRIVTWMGENRDAAAQYDAELKKLISDLQNCGSKSELTQLEQQFRGIQTQVKATESVSTGFFGNLKNGIKKEFRKYIKIADDRVLNTEKAHIELLAADEIFVQVNYADCYWISNYGRMANNNRLDKSFRLHKTKESGENPVHWTVVSYDIDGTPCHVETTPGVLVAEHFLLKNTGCNKIWHIDENIHNNNYKNLIYVSEKEYEFLRKHVITVEQLGREQEYRDYNTVKCNPAYGIWYFMYARCYPEKSSLISNACYDEASMCDLWLNDKDAFAEWYSMNYYECGGEKMAIDKDLLCRGNKIYAPDKCCLLPQTLNCALASATKRRVKNGKPYAIGVEFSSYRNKYYAKIQPFGEERGIVLHYWDTEEEAFQEYKLFKESEIRILALRYRDKLPDHIFDALIRYEVRPYSPYEK